MASNIDPTKPTAGQATTQSVRDNFSAAKTEIEALQPGGGQSFTDYLAGYETNQRHINFDGDLDTILINSNYRINATNVTNEPADMPVGSVGFIATMVNSTNTNNALQFIYGQSGAIEYLVWMRSRVNSVWSAWKLVVDGGAFTERLAGYEDDGFSTRFDGDLDTLLTNSKYFCFAAAVTNGPADFISDSGQVVTMPRDGSSFIAVQIIYGAGPANSHKIWMRARDASVWGAWKLVVDGAAFPLRLDGYDDNQRHTEYTGDLDAIAINSVYTINNANVTNFPADFSSIGTLDTSIWDASTDIRRQVLWGMDSPASGKYKQWVRNFSNSWDAWKLVVDGGAFTQRLAGLEDTGLSTVFIGDLNTVLHNSEYVLFEGNVTNGPPDWTTNASSFLYTKMWTTDQHGTQILLGMDNSEYKQWQRQLASGVWDAWKLVVDGNLLSLPLPTSDPLVSGALWNNGGVVNVST